jgi:hypothetical protein
MMPEVIFLTWFIICFRDIKEKRSKLFIFLIIGYITLIMLFRYQLLFYIAYIIYSYVLIKKLYKAHIIDLFVISLGYAYMTIISFACFKLINDYWVAFIINRIILFIPLLFGSIIKMFYKKYKILWNINKDAKIKSITIRNISLVVINLMIVIMNFIMIFLINKI